MLESNHPPTKYVSRAVSREVKRPRCEDDHIRPSSVEVKNE